MLVFRNNVANVLNNDPRCEDIVFETLGMIFNSCIMLKNSQTCFKHLPVLILEDVGPFCNIILPETLSLVFFMFFQVCFDMFVETAPKYTTKEKLYTRRMRYKEIY